MAYTFDKNDVWSREIRAALSEAYHDTGWDWIYNLIHYPAHNIPIMNIKKGEQPGTLVGYKREDWAKWIESGGEHKRKVITFKMGKLLRGAAQYSTPPDSQVEKLVNTLTATLWPVVIFERVTGKAIKESYNGKNYASNAGTLNNSCMRYDNCNHFFQLYWKNPEVCSLLVSRDGSDRISGRALVWETTEGVTVMDRVYGNDVTQHAFLRYAREQGWWIRKNQCDSDGWVWELPDGSTRVKHLRVAVDKCDFGTYPYMDTFRMLSKKDGYISTDSDDGEWAISSTQGDAGYVGERIPCDHCGGLSRQSNLYNARAGLQSIRVCYRCIRSSAFRQCYNCGVYGDSELVRMYNGRHYCNQHAPAMCSGTCGGRVGTYDQYRIEGRPYCANCYNEYYAEETYTSATGRVLTRLEYDSRYECETCHRYWWSGENSIPLSYMPGGGLECNECATTRRAAAAERDYHWIMNITTAGSTAPQCWDRILTTE